MHQARSLCPLCISPDNTLVLQKIAISRLAVEKFSGTGTCKKGPDLLKKESQMSLPVL